MEQIIAKIDGMMCGMCESHMNDMVRNNFKSLLPMRRRRL